MWIYVTRSAIMFVSDNADKSEFKRQLREITNWRGNDMVYITAKSDMAEEIKNVLHTTINMVYSKYYPKEVVDFFCQHHSLEHILEGISSGNMGVLMDNETIIGTGCIHQNHITGLYILPCYQNQGYGSYILDCLEKEIEKHYTTSILDASLPAVFLYERRGYKTVGHGVHNLENDVKLVYEIMEKQLKDLV